VRIISEAFLAEASENFPKAAKFLKGWETAVRAANWKNLQDVRKTYSNADAVVVESGRKVVVFNVCGNDYRLIAALHYNRQIAYTLKFMTHAEYSKNRWKHEL